jgi:mRNA interferase MazF
MTVFRGRDRSPISIASIARHDIGENSHANHTWHQHSHQTACNEFNDSAIRTSVGAAITSNMRLADAPGNGRITRRVSGLPHDSVVNVSQLITLDKRMLTENVGRLPAQPLRDVEAGIKLVLAL